MKGSLRPGAPVSRRDFVRSLAGTAAAFSVPLIVPSRLLGADAPSNRVRVGHIGCGRIARGHDMPGVFKSGLADVAAVCDLDAKRLAGGEMEGLTAVTRRPCNLSPLKRVIASMHLSSCNYRRGWKGHRAHPAGVLVHHQHAQ